MRNLTFRWRLFIGFGIVLCVAMAIGAVGYHSTYTMSDQNDLVVANAKLQNNNMEMEWAMAVQTEAVRSFLLTNDTHFLAREGDMRRHFAECAGVIANLANTDRVKQMLGSINALHDRQNATFDKILSLQKDGRRDEAVRLAFSEEVIDQQAQAQKAMQDLDELGDSLVQQAIQGHDQAESGSRFTIALVGLLGLAAGSLCALLVVRSMTGPIHLLVENIKAIESKDLTVKDLEVTSQDELGEAARALNAMKSSLHEVVASLAGSADQLAAASRQLAKTSSSVAQGADSQKGQVHQVASAMQEMSATVHEISNNSNEAARSASQAADVARDGGTIVEDALGRMQSIAQSVEEASQKVGELGDRSDEIGKIVGVIHEIAKQTNLLALNAAIEAARAGEQGRGFAVVAAEVRRLAERTTTATREIGDVIQGVQSETHAVVETMLSGTRQVQEGVKVTATAGESLKKIISEAENVGQMVAQIATAATQQSSATEEVSSTMTSFNALASTSADEAQSAASACEQLTSLANELRNTVDLFRILGRDADNRQRSGTAN